MSLHQHSILKTKSYQQQELTTAQYSEEETHHYQQQTAVDDTGLIFSVSNKVSYIPVDNFTINIELFPQTL
jgi:hypothetical protein